MVDVVQGKIKPDNRNALDKRTKAPVAERTNVGGEMAPCHFRSPVGDEATNGVRGAGREMGESVPFPIPDFLVIRGNDTIAWVTKERGRSEKVEKIRFGAPDNGSYKRIVGKVTTR